MCTAQVCMLASIKPPTSSAQSPHMPLAPPAQMCVACEAPDTLAAAVARASELGLAVTHRSVHEALIHWGALQEVRRGGPCCVALQSAFVAGSRPG